MFPSSHGAADGRGAAGEGVGAERAGEAVSLAERGLAWAESPFCCLQCKDSFAEELKGYALLAARR